MQAPAAASHLERAAWHMAAFDRRDRGADGMAFNQATTLLGLVHAK